MMNSKGTGEVDTAIHIFPYFANLHSIHLFRKQYDPLANLISPHITLVFPFKNSITDENLKRHVIQCTSKQKPFHIMLRGVSGADEVYLFLNVKTGNDQIIALHDELYTGILAEHLNRRYTYTPHLTIGRIEDELTFSGALRNTAAWDETFTTTVREVVVEHIDEHHKSTAAFRVPLLG
ncbi:2'-5' RNA ligase family protein [Alicyclobacillus sp. SO9]|uniref:2'-5' RNA ligase family protein n=1 Tax=Alicyclobacillus sp. SO9 TaxID=2665646 RepID=UPI0018E783EC|nr:2'-5' RNA ligase family protein [Alicyclobacillus sp. SO9]QQE81027.1 2'-5' RNA ligase family protein [Alicyclobacillus sp. SO9]